MEPLGLFFIGAPPTTSDTGLKNKSVINLSTCFQLTDNHINLLQKGLSFIPTSTILPNCRQSTQGLIQGYHRRLKLTAYYGDSTPNETPPFQNQSRWEPNNEYIPTELLDLIKKINRTYVTYIYIKKNPILLKKRTEPYRSYRT